MTDFMGHDDEQEPVVESASTFDGWAMARLLAFVLVAVAAIYSSAQTFNLARDNKATLERINRESADRRQQVCLQAEREHKTNVDSLKRTYRYVLQLTPREKGSTFNRFIIAQIPKTEETASIDVAPDFCDAPGVEAETLYKRTHGKQGSPPVGLAEPDPVVPKRPVAVSKLIRDLANSGPVLKRKHK